MSVESLAQALLEAGILDATSVEMRVPRARSGRKLLDDIIGDGISTEASLVSQLARALSVPRYDPKERQPEPDALSTLDLRIADELGVLPVAVRGGGALLWVAMCDPTDEALLQDVQRRTGRRVKACLIGPRELGRALQQLQAGAAPAPSPTTTGQFRAAAPAPSMPPQPVPQQAPQPHLPTAVPVGMPMAPMGYGSMPGMMPNGMGMMTGQYAAYGYPGAMPGMSMPGMQMPQHQTVPPAPQQPPPAAAPAARPAEVQKLEEELAQAKQVVKVLAQLLVERGVIDGEELKRRLRAERDRK